MRKTVSMALATALGLAASVPALADSKSAAEFVLKTCLPAMDDLSKVEVMARENNWTPKSLPSFGAPNRFQKSHSMWDVAQGEDRFSVNVWISHLGQKDYNICFVTFLNNNVSREEFLSFTSASVQLTLIADTSFALIHMRSETYEIESAKMLLLDILSQPDGNVSMASIQETFARLSPLPAAPAVPSPN
jgi:hypothetical protein